MILRLHYGSKRIPSRSLIWMDKNENVPGIDNSQQLSTFCSSRTFMINAEEHSTMVCITYHHCHSNAIPIW